MCATGSSEEMICLKSSVIFHVSNLYSTFTHKYAMPFQQKHSFYQKGDFMSNSGRHRLALYHSQHSNERVHLF